MKITDAEVKIILEHMEFVVWHRKLLHDRPPTDEILQLLDKLRKEISGSKLVRVYHIIGAEEQILHVGHTKLDPEKILRETCREAQMTTPANTYKDTSLLGNHLRDHKAIYGQDPRVVVVLETTDYEEAYRLKKEQAHLIRKEPLSPKR